MNTSSATVILYSLEGRNFQHKDFTDVKFKTRKPVDGFVTVEWIENNQIQTVKYKASEVAAHVFAGLWVPVELNSNSN